MAMIREFFQNLLYQVPSIGISDIVDILVVSIIFYSLLRLIRSTSAARVARAILLLLAITLLTDVLNLYTLNWLLNKILEVGAIALIIVFQPELRRALERVGAQLHFHLLSSESGATTEQSAISATVQACEIMSRERVGVLLISSAKRRSTSISRPAPSSTRSCPSSCCAISSLKTRPCTTARSLSAVAVWLRRAASCR